LFSSSVEANEAPAEPAGDDGCEKNVEALGTPHPRLPLP